MKMAASQAYFVLGLVMAAIYCGQAQRLSQGASDWYMRFHNNFDFVKRNVDRPVTKSFLVTSNVHHRYAVTSVSVVVHNPATSVQSYNFGFVMPKEALVSNVTIQRGMAGGNQIMVDENDFVTATINRSQLMEHLQAQEAEANEEEAKAEEIEVNSDRASFHQFVLPINLRPDDDTVITLVYEHLLERNGDKYSNVISLSPNDVVNDFQVRLSIVDNYPLKSISVNAPVIGTVMHQESPGHSIQWAFNMSEVEQSHYFGSHGFTGDLIADFQLQDDPKELDVILEEDIFVHFYKGPKENLQHMSSHLIFLLDLSSSMLGHNLDMAKEALSDLLQNMSGNDFFNLVTFNDRENKEPQDWIFENDAEVKANPCDAAHIQAVLDYVMALESTASGGNNSSALPPTSSLSKVLKHSFVLGANASLPANVVSRVVLLTDGASNNIKRVPRRQRLPILAIGFGFDANLDFLETRVAYESDDLVENVIEDMPVADQLQGVRNFLSGVILKDVRLRYYGENGQELKGSGSRFGILRKGSSLVVAGPMASDNILSTVKISAQSAEGKYLTKLAFVPEPKHIGCTAQITLCTKKEFGGFCKSFNHSETKLGKFGKKVASAKIEGTCSWLVFTKANFDGPSLTLKPGAYEVLPGQSYKKIYSFKATKTDENHDSSANGEHNAAGFAKRIWAYLTVQNALRGDLVDPELAKLTYNVAVEQNFLTPYTNVDLGSRGEENAEIDIVDPQKQLVTFDDLSPVFFQVDDPEVDRQWEALMECQKPVVCEGNFHYQIEEDASEEQRCSNGSLTLFTRPGFEGESLVVSRSINQLYHSNNRLRIRSFLSMGDCCWLLFNHQGFAGNVEKICGNSEQPIWKQNIASVKKIGEQPPPTDNV